MWINQISRDRVKQLSGIRTLPARVASFKHAADSFPMAEHVPLDNGPRPPRSPAEKESLWRYWRSNLRIMAVLLVVWFVAGLGCGVLWADKLNEFTLPGTAFPLGFWFAQQGSIVVFVVVILVYCVLMNRLDRKHHNELVEIRRKEGR
jgi:putative solute:sodium symporter small subunit